MLIHGMRTGQKFAESFCTNRNRQRQPDGRPQRIAAAHPIPKPKGGGDAKGIGRRHIGRQRSKVPCRVCAALRLKPGFGRAGIGHGLNGGESFAGNQEQRTFGLDILQSGGQFMTIDIANKVHALA